MSKMFWAVFTLTSLAAATAALQSDWLLMTAWFALMFLMAIWEELTAIRRALSPTVKDTE